MKTLPIAFALSGLFLIAAHEPSPDLAIGASMPMADKVMKDVVGKDMSLAQIKGEKGLLVIFSCNSCPFVVGSEGSAGWEGRYPEIGVQARKAGIGFALVNSNSAKREGDDSFDLMKSHYKEKNYNSHYLLDENNEVADAFAARTTPHVFLFDKDLKLVYKGAIDDNVDAPKAVTKPYLKNAMDALVAGKAIDPATTRNLGCSIKRVHAAH
jgi:thioredoxin-related protein